MPPVPDSPNSPPLFLYRGANSLSRGRKNFSLGKGKGQDLERCFEFALPRRLCAGRTRRRIFRRGGKRGQGGRFFPDSAGSAHSAGRNGRPSHRNPSAISLRGPARVKFFPLPRLLPKSIILYGFVKSPSAALRFTPQFLRAWHLELFTKPSKHTPHHYFILPLQGKQKYG
jgi:hypothetical protein